MHPNIEIKSSGGASARYHAKVFDAASGKLVRDYGERKNLILPGGIDGSKSFSQVLGCAAVGTGTTPNKVTIDGTYSQTGTTLTRVTGSGTFVAGNVNDFVKFGSGKRAKIVSVTNTVTVEVDREQTVAASSLTIYDTSRTQLDAPVGNRTNTQELGANTATGNSGTGETTYSKTFNFPTEATARTYNEIGIANSTSLATPLFGRLVLDSPISVDVGQFLQVKVNLIMKPSNYFVPEPITVNVTGWPRPYVIESITPGVAGGTAFDILLTEDCNGHYAVGRPIIVTGALPAKFVVSTYASTGSDFTVTTTAAHGRSPGDSIVIEGATPSAYNGTWTVATVPNSTTMTVTSAINPGAGSGGTVRLATPATWYNGTWTIASFPTSKTIRVTDATVTVAAGQSGNVTNSIAATAVIANYAYVPSTDISSFSGVYEIAMNTGNGKHTLDAFTEAQMKTGMGAGFFTSPTPSLGSVNNSLTATGDYEVADRRRPEKYTFASGAIVSQTIRQLCIYGSGGCALWITFDERQRKDDGYQLVIEWAKTWEPDLS